MKKKTTRSAKTAASAAPARRPAKPAAAKAKAKPKKAAKAKAPKAVRAPAKRKVASKKRAVRPVTVRRAVRARSVKPVRAQTPPPTPPAAAPVVPPALKMGLSEITSPPATLSSLVRQAQATQPLPTLPAEPAKPKPEAPAAPLPQPLPIPPILLEGDERTHPVIPGPVEKFVLGPTPPPEAPKVEVSELPQDYGTGKLFLTARDPHCLYAHWDLSEAQQRRYSGFAHHLALRLYREHLSGERVAESVVEPGARHGFLHVAQAGVSYVAQLGCYQPGGEWLALAASEPAATPPEAVAEDKTVRWGAVEPFTPAAPPQPAPPPGPAPAPEPVPAFAAAATPPPAVPEYRAESVRTAPAPEPWRAETPRVQAEPVAVATPPVTLPPTWSPAQERIFAEMLEIALGQPRTVGSVELVERSERRAWREVSVPGEQAGASLPVALPLGGPASLPVPMEQEVLGISSAPPGAPPGPARQFWFNVNVEVVVYGATEPSARVTLGGLPLRLRPDGTFSCRFALPDGRYDLPAVAVAVDNDTRRAHLTLGRRTEYHGEVGVHPQDKALRPPVPEHVQAAQGT